MFPLFIPQWGTLNIAAAGICSVILAQDQENLSLICYLVFISFCFKGLTLHGVTCDFFFYRRNCRLRIWKQVVCLSSLERILLMTAPLIRSLWWRNCLCFSEVSSWFHQPDLEHLGRVFQVDKRVAGCQSALSLASLTGVRTFLVSLALHWFIFISQLPTLHDQYTHIYMTETTDVHTSYLYYFKLSYFISINLVYHQLCTVSPVFVI